MNPQKSIQALKADVAQILKDVPKEEMPFVVMEDGEAKAVLLDIESYENAQETLALLKILALGDVQIKNAQTHSAADIMAELRATHR